MALIIKGNVPKSNGCDGCEFQTSRCEQLDACTCFLFNGCIHNFHNERHKDCPIIGEISDSHGDLIDRGLVQEVLAQLLPLVITNELTDKEIGLVHRTVGAISEMINEQEVVVEATE